jgi:hypothetical protein
VEEGAPVELEEFFGGEAEAAADGHGDFVDDEGVLGGVAFPRVEGFEEAEEGGDVGGGYLFAGSVFELGDHLADGLAGEGDVADADHFFAVEFVGVFAVEADLVAAGLFGGVHGFVGAGDELFVGEAFPVGGDADADGDLAAGLAVLAAEAVVFDSLPQALGDFAGFVDVGVAHDDEEFLAAEAADGVVAADVAGEDGGEFGEEDVADDVAVAVVVFFEVVDVDHEQADGFAFTAGAFDVGFEGGHEVGGVVELGLGVADGHLLEVAVGGFEFADDAPDVAFGGEDDAQGEAADDEGEDGAEQTEGTQGEEGGDQEVLQVFLDLEGALLPVVVEDGGAGGHAVEGRGGDDVFVGEGAVVGVDSEGHDAFGWCDAVADFDEARDVVVPELGVVVDGEGNGVGEDGAAQVGEAVAVAQTHEEVGGRHGDADDDADDHREDEHAVGELTGEADALYHLTTTYSSGVPPLSVMMARPSGEEAKATKALARGLSSPLYMKVRFLTQG